MLLQLAGVSAQDILRRSNNSEKTKFYHGETPLLTTARKLYNPFSVEQLLNFTNSQDFITFLVGRDPFQRLVSAFRDQIGESMLGLILLLTTLCHLIIRICLCWIALRRVGTPDCGKISSKRRQAASRMG